MSTKTAKKRKKRAHHWHTGEYLQMYSYTNAVRSDNKLKNIQCRIKKSNANEIIIIIIETLKKKNNVKKIEKSTVILPAYGNRLNLNTHKHK